MENLNMTDYLKKVRTVFSAYPQIKLVYLFGSTARGDRGPMSDYDFAVFLGNKDSKEVTRIRFELMDKLSRALNTENTDVVMLDMARSPELKYNILQEGQLIFEREPFRVIYEPAVLNEYFDFSAMLQRHGLTKA
jgi:predicted nucleotidyltransferase